MDYADEHAAHAQALEADNAQWPARLTRVPEKQYDTSRPPGLIDVWRSRTHLVQIYRAPQGHRLSILRSALTPGGHRWQDGMTWDELQRLKSECGYGDRWAVEIYPPDVHVVDVANIRHLWVLPHRPHFAWTRET